MWMRFRSSVPSNGCTGRASWSDLTGALRRTNPSQAVISEYSALRGPYEFCRGITPEQKAELPTWTERAAEAGDAFGLTSWARSLGETEAGLAAWEKAWRHGIRGALAELATLYERGVADGQPDYVRAYAFRLISLKLHEAWYGERPSTMQRNDVDSMERSLRHTSGFLTPQEQA